MNSNSHWFLHLLISPEKKAVKPMANAIHTPKNILATLVSGAALTVYGNILAKSSQKGIKTIPILRNIKLKRDSP